VIFGQATLTLLGLLHAVAAYSYFSKERHATRWASGWIVLTGLAVWQLPAYPLASPLIFGAVIAAWTWWWESIPALAARTWIPEDARQATATLTETHLVVHDLRNFTWQAARDFVPCWEERSYDLANLIAVDLFVSTWGDPRIAHLIVSFVFSDNVPLAFSIEIRRQTGEKWSMLAGLMKSYELVMIAADERDVIRVRTNVRHERVRRYRLVTTPAMRQRILVRYIEELNDLAARPRFYNTLYRNCTTEVVRILREAGLSVPVDWRLLVSGYMPEYLYQHRLIASDQPLARLQPAADIGVLAQAADADPAFSTCIRREPGAT
jgi:hypothetical protein